MKIQVSLVAVLVAYVSGAAVPNQESGDIVKVLESFEDVRPAFVGSRNLFDGMQNPGDKLLHSNPLELMLGPRGRGYYTKVGTTNVIQTQDVRFVGAASTRISYIEAFAVGNTQSATAQITAGGVNTNSVTIRLTSDRGAGFVFWVNIWGR